MTAAHPLDWIQEIERSLVDLDERPQFGLQTPLNWDALESELRTLTTSDLKITHSMKGWVDVNQAFAGLGAKLIPLSIEWSPLKNPAFFLTDQQNMKDLLAILAGGEEAANYFYEASYVQGFYHYFAAEVLRVLTKQSFAKPLAPCLGTLPEDLKQSIGDEACFVIDLSISLQGKNLWGKILLTEDFRQEWKTYFAHLPPASLTPELQQKILVDLHLEVAHTRLSVQEWKQVKNGDFILLDHCSYDPLEHKGGVILTLNQKPVFRGRIKEEGIKITNYPMYDEVKDSMEEDDKDLDTEDEDYDDEDDDDLYSDFDDDDEESELEEEEEDIFAGLEPKKEVRPAKEKKTAEASLKVSLSKEEKETVNIDPEDLPINLTVEVGRIRMTVGALMNLAPGNLLELNVSPEQGVDLVVSGKKVGRGELLRIGDVLGIRIISL